jgi:hypothetical protein
VCGQDLVTGAEETPGPALKRIGDVHMPNYGRDGLAVWPYSVTTYANDAHATSPKIAS